MLEFAKGEALGNDYLIVEGVVAPELARRICDRHRGAGGDGVLAIESTARPFRLRIFNPDGSEAEKSGNGLRILGAWLHRTERVVTGEEFEVELATDTVRMTVEAELDGGALDISVRMGPARFLDDDSTAPGAEIDAAGERIRVHAASLGNPHCVVVVDELDRDRFLRLGPALERHAYFANGTNVQLARRVDGGTMEAWIWERGVGETLASGSSASAVAAVARRLGLLDRETVEVRMPGGKVTVRVDDGFDLTLRGPARIVYEGRYLLA